MENKNLNELESLRLIESMIASAKTDIHDNGFRYLLWGWLVFVASLSQYILLTVVKYPYHYMVWMLMPVGGIISGIYGYRERKNAKVKTYIGEFLGYLWIAFCIALIIVLVFSNKIGYTNSNPLIMALYGIGTFVSGGILKFKPLIYGGICCFVLSAIAFIVPFEIQLLLLSVSVLLGYIIPGYMLKAQSKA
jgi:hypothetical protein